MKKCAIFLSFLILLVPAAEATQVLYQSLDQLGENSSAVVRGTVGGVRSYWNDIHTKIFTETTITVDETFKGLSTGTVRVVQIGGTVDNIRVTAHGALQWKQGEEVVLFLEDLADGTFQVAGFSQGKFLIERDPRSGAAYVMRPALDGAQLVGGDKSAGAPIEKIPLDRFMDEALGERTPAIKN